MSRVFIATEVALGRAVVVKVLPRETAASISIERFQREIQLAARLQHPHIVPLLSAGETEGLPYFTMPFVEGESLRIHVDRHGEMPVGEAIRVLREVASALAYAHENGIVHRDIKPDNVLLSGGSAMVTDFGVAKAVSSGSNADHAGLTSLGVALGTPAYMSPEQASADPTVDHRADIYAFGVLAYELLTGQTPFGGRTPQGLLAAHVTEPPEPIQKRRPSLPPALAALVMRCLEKRPADRPQSAGEIVRALDDWGMLLGGMGQRGDGVAWSTGQRATADHAILRSPLLRVLVAASLLAAMAGGVVLWRQRSASVILKEPNKTRRVAVAPFRNIDPASNAPAMGAMTADWIAQGLASTDLVQVVALDGPTTPDSARVLSRLARAVVLVGGEYAVVGDSIQVQGRLVDVATGAIVTITDWSRATKGNPMPALDHMRQSVLAALAAYFDARVSDYAGRSAQPPTFASYQEYVTGMEHFVKHEYRDAVTHLEASSAIDSNFRRGSIFAAVSLLNLGRVREADSLARMLHRSRDRFTVGDRHFVDWLLAAVSGDRNSALEAIRLCDALVPGTLWSYQHAWQALALNKPREALSALAEIDYQRGELRGWANYWILLAMSHHLEHDFAQELEDGRRGRALFPRSSSMLSIQVRGLLGQGHVTAALALVDSIANDASSGAASAITSLLQVSRDLAWAGHPAEARMIAGRALLIAQAAPIKSGEFLPQVLAMRLAYAAGQLDVASRMAGTLLQRDSSRAEYLAMIGRVAARQGQRSMADSIDRVLQAYVESPYTSEAIRGRARIASILGRRGDAVGLLQLQLQRGSGGSTNLWDGDPDLLTLRGFAPFEALMIPKG